MSFPDSRWGTGGSVGKMSFGKKIHGLFFSSSYCLSIPSHWGERKNPNQPKTDREESFKAPVLALLDFCLNPDVLQPHRSEVSGSYDKRRPGVQKQPLSWTERRRFLSKCSSGDLATPFLPARKEGKAWLQLPPYGPTSSRKDFIEEGNKR